MFSSNCSYHLIAGSIANYDLSSTSSFVTYQITTQAIQIQYQGMKLIGDTSNKVYDFAIELFDSGSIEFHYLHVYDPITVLSSLSARWLVGIQNDLLVSTTGLNDVLIPFPYAMTLNDEIDMQNQLQYYNETEIYTNNASTTITPMGTFPNRTSIQSNTKIQWCPIGGKQLAEH